MAKKTAPKTPVQADEAGQDYTQPRVPINVITVKEGFNPRSVLGDLTELVNNIKEHGILEPLVVCPNEDGDGLYIVAGHRRFAAAQEAGLEDVPIHLFPNLTIDSDEAFAIAMSENSKEGRTEISDIDQANAFQRLIDQGKKPEHIAQTCGYSRTYVRTTLKLNEIPESVREKLKSGEISKKAAIAVMSIPEEVRDQVVADKLSPGTTEADVHKFANAARNALKKASAPAESSTDSDEEVTAPVRRNAPAGNIPGRIGVTRTQTEVREQLETLAKILFASEETGNEQSAFAHAWAIAALLWQCGVLDEVTTDSDDFGTALDGLRQRVGVKSDEDTEDLPKKKAKPAPVEENDDEEEDVRPKKRGKAKKAPVDSDDEDE